MTITLFKMSCCRPAEVKKESFGRCCYSSMSAIVWRLPILIWAVCTAGWSVATFWGHTKLYLLYMTHWGLLMIIIESAVGVYVAARRNCKKIDDATFGLPWYVKVYWVLYNITIPLAFLITVFYWCLLKSSGSHVKYAPDPILDVMLHGVNSAVMLIELLCSAHPSRIQHIFQPIFFAIAYLLFSVTYYYAGGLDPWGNVFIYPVIDWSKPDKTIVVIAMTGMFLALAHLVTVAIATARDAIANRLRKETTGVYNEGFTA